MIIAMLCALFAPPQRAQAQEAYVHQSPDKATLTFYYDTQRNARQGQTWGIEEKKTVTIRIRGKKISFTIPAWTGYSEHANTVTKKAVFDASFQNIKPTSTKGWFQYLEALHTIEGLQYLNTSQVTDMTGMFAQCNQLEKLDLTTFNTANVSNMTSMFIHCEKLKQINLTSFNTQKVTEMSSMFAQCNQLETILCNSTWQCKNSKYMFQGCTALKGAVKYDASKLDATMANPTNGYFTAQKLEAYVHMSQDKTTLTFFYDKQRYNRQGQTWGINEKRTDLPQVPAWAGIHQTPNTTTKAVFDGSFQNFKPTSTAYWFFFFKKLAAIEGFQYLNTSEVTDMSGMFANCKSLTNINLKNFNTEKVTGMSSMFASCSGLTTLDLKSFNTENVKNMSEMFAFSSALTNLDLTSFNTEKVTDMKDMFAGCSALTTLDLKNFNTSNVTEMNRMFN